MIIEKSIMRLKYNIDFIYWLFVFALVLRSTSALAADPCAALSRDDCFRSTECTVKCEQADGDGSHCRKYLCGHKSGECEEGVSQSSMTKAQCESRSGCQFREPICYCPEHVECVCGGGLPPRCIDTRERQEISRNEAPPRKGNVLRYRHKEVKF